MHQFRQRIRQAARADIVNRQNRIRIRQRAATVDDLLRAPLHFGIAALHRIKIQIRQIGAGVHARRRAATQANQHAGATQLDQQRSGRRIEFAHMTRGDIAYAARNHDRLVIAAHFAGHVLFIGAKVAREIRPAEFIVERRATDGAVDHDLQRGADTRRPAIRKVLPRLRKIRNVEIRHREPGQSRLRFGAATGGALVANFTARPGGSPRKRRNRGGMIVRLHFHQDVRLVLDKTVLAVLPGIKTLDARAFNHRRIVRISHHRAARIFRVRGADHAEQRNILRRAVDHPISVKNLVPAVFRIGLREHHQFHVRRIAPDVLEVLREIFDFVFRQRQPEFAISPCQCRHAAAEDIHRVQRLGIETLKQLIRVFHRAKHRFGHAVVNQGPQLRGQRGGLRGRHAIDPIDPISRATLNALHRFQTTVACDVGGLGRPRRNRAGPG